MDGSTTEDGRKLIAWIESHYLEADKANDVTLINSLSGDIKHHYTMVTKLKTLTSAQWLNDYKHSIAMSAWRNYQYTESQAVKESQLEATTAKADALEAGLNEFKEAIAAQIAKLQEDNARLNAELEKARSKGKRKATEDADEDAEV